MIAPASRVDVSHLPDFAYDHRDPLWWGTVGFIVIEGTTLLVCMASYLYLARNFPQWPPPGTPLPALLPATLALGLAFLSVVPATMADRAARAMDPDRTRRALGVHFLFGLGLLGLRAFELLALRTRWDAHAYGSIVWLILGVHTTLVLTDVADTALVAMIFQRRRQQNKHYADVPDNSLYWYFVVVTWLLVYVLIYLSPRWL